MSDQAPVKKPFIVGFGHRKRVGKDLSARLLADLLSPPRSVEVCGFAGKLKEVCADLYGWAGLRQPDHYDRHPEDREEFIDALGQTHRQVWISVGNRLREIHADVWVRSLLDSTRCDVLLIPDVRYPNEVKAIRESGGLLVKVERDSVGNTDDVADVALSDFNGWNHVIRNNGSVDSLRNQIVRLSLDVMDCIATR